MEELGRKFHRGKLVIPALLRDLDSDVEILAVILDISATGMRVVTNNRVVMMTEPDVLKQKKFRILFDFFDIDTSEIYGKIIHIKPGIREQYEKQLGIEFTQIQKEVSRDINRHVLSNLS